MGWEAMGWVIVGDVLRISTNGEFLQLREGPRAGSSRS